MNVHDILVTDIYFVCAKVEVVSQNGNTIVLHMLQQLLRSNHKIVATVVEMTSSV